MERIRNAGQFGTYRYFLCGIPSAGFPPVVSPPVDFPPVENLPDYKERKTNTYTQKKETSGEINFVKKRNGQTAKKAKETAKFARWAEETNRESQKEKELVEFKKKVLQWMKDNPEETAELEIIAKRESQNANPHLSGRLLDPMIRVRVRAMVAKKIPNLSGNE